MYTKAQEGPSFKNSYPKCFKTKHFDKFHCQSFSCCININSFSGRMSKQTTNYKRQEESSERQAGSSGKNSCPKCFKTTNFDKFHRKVAS